ncbi:hypothetical protein B5S32_g2863 [[Candida] boidinii]|nr:hypothetical protein B5S32_g2863 [[Candida] boidinii]
MGRLIGLELYNFKSYRGLSSIGFGTSHFTSIIGPNGSGKSNMMDAISFVLGIRSNHLRSSRLKDLIYRGRVMKSNLAGSKNADAIEVDDIANESEDDNMEQDDNDEEDIEDENLKVEIDEDQILTQNTNEEDPELAYVMAIYEKSNGEILKLKRTITKNGLSSYKVNGLTVTALQYSEILKTENILIKARNFLVFQGDVEKIASQSSEDLTKLIEIISGSIDYKKDYDRLLDEKEKCHNETISKNSKKRTLREEYNQYSEQTKEVKLFQSRNQQLLDLIQKKYLVELYHIDIEIDKFSKEHNDLIKNLKNIEKNKDKENKLLNSSISSESKEKLQLKRYERQIEKLKKLIKENQLILIPLISKLTELDKKLKNYDVRIETLTLDYNNQKEIVETTEKQLNSLKKAFKNYLSEYENNNSNSIGLSENALNEYNKLRENFLMKGGYIESKLNDISDEINSINKQIENLNNQKFKIESRISELIRNKTEIKSKLIDNDLQISQINSTVENKKQKLNDLRNQRDSIVQKEFSINSKLKEVLLKLNELNATERESKRERQLRENCASLRRLFPGVKGLVYDLCKPKKKKFENAISIILGKNFDSIVVDSISTAQKCVEYLKEQRAGTASFIPLDSVEVQSPGESLRTIHEGIRPSIDVVDYEPEYEKAIQYVCSNSVICDDMNLAKQLRWERNIEVKAVTLQGFLIHKSGLMTGGSTRNDNKKWDKAEVRNLTNQKDELKLQLEKLRDSIPSELLDKNILDDLNELQNKLPVLNETKSDLIRLINDRDVEIKHQNEILEEINSKITENTELLDSKSNDSEDVLVEIRELENEIYAKFCDKYGFVNGIQDYEENHGRKSREHSKEKVRFNKQISILENKLSFEIERLEESEKRVSKIKKDHTILLQDKSKTEKSKKEIQDLIDKTESEYEVLKEDFDKINDKINSKHDELKILESKVEDFQLEINELKKKIFKLDESINNEKINKFGLLRTCKLENVKLPLEFGSLEDIPIDENEELDETDSTNTRYNELFKILDDIEISYSVLTKNDKEGKLQDLLDNISTEITTLTETINNMNPNMKSSQRLEEVKERMDAIDTEFKSAKEQEKEIVSQFNDIKIKRYELFSNAFENISSKIDPIYKELTKSNVSPLGGSAYLTLEDEDEPYLSGVKYHAMPPLKRFRDMDLLSGGEKSIAALALLFAIHSFQPSPFFVLDEVDAALDNANVNRIANYISKHSGPDFQFIVISLKNCLFERSDAIVGIYRKQDLNSSKTLTLDLRGYPTEQVSAT